MPVAVDGPRRTVLLEAAPLCQETFCQFGNVIENPAPGLAANFTTTPLPPNAVLANQGSAVKFLDVTQMEDLYGSAPSKARAKVVFNMFSCAPRKLHHNPLGSPRFPVRILERHPYTSQTFVPLGLSGTEAKQARYLVVVALSLDPSPMDEALPVPLGTLLGRGLPDLTRVKAFIAKSSQAVTYGAGTWHSPMVVVGMKPIDFVVVQFSNGIEIEDCQEVELRSSAQELLVEVPEVNVTGSKGLWKL